MFQGKKTVSLGQGSVDPASAKRFTLKVALWLRDSPHLGSKPRIKHLAGRLLKQPARQGVVVAQSRLGQMLCNECGSARDRRMGHELLRQAARSGDPQAQFEYGRLCADLPDPAPERARHWLELSAAQGLPEARHLLRRLFPD